MKTIKKKIWQEYFEAIASGRKRYEFRVADFEVAEGDVLILQEWNPDTKEYTGRELQKKISYVGKFTIDSFVQREALEKHGFYILSFE